MAQGPFEPKYEQPAVLAATGLTSATIQNWVNRGTVTLTEQHPGRQAKRRYSEMDVIRIAIMAELVRLGIAPGDAWANASSVTIGIASFGRDRAAPPPEGAPVEFFLPPWLWPDRSDDAPDEFLVLEPTRTGGFSIFHAASPEAVADRLYPQRFAGQVLPPPTAAIVINLCQIVRQVRATLKGLSSE